MEGEGTDGAKEALVDSDPPSRHALELVPTPISEASFSTTALLHAMDQFPLRHDRFRYDDAQLHGRGSFRSARLVGKKFFGFGSGSFLFYLTITVQLWTN
jgi:hypothetical protein